MKLNVIILAGGQSKRFWPLEEKNLFEFFGTPLIVYQIKRYTLFLKREGFVPNFIVVTNEVNHALIKTRLQQSNLTGPVLITQTLPDQSGAVIAALKKVEHHEPILIVNSNDIFSETLVTDLLKKVPKGNIILTASQVKSYFPGGYLVRDHRGKIQKIWEKPPENLVPTKLNLFRFVLDYYHDKELLAEIFNRNTTNHLSYEDAINILLEKNEAEIVINDQPFTSLKYPWHILSAMQIFLASIKESTVKTQDIDPSAQIVGKVFIADGVKIGSFSKIIGPTFIGKNTTVGDQVLIRDSHIGEHCLIGAHSEVARSYLGHGVLLHRNYVGDSVLNDKTSFGANALTANWRFDEQMIKSALDGKKTDTNFFKLGAIVGSQAKIGVAVCLMPGVKIGKNAKVLPNQTVYKDISE